MKAYMSVEEYFDDVQDLASRLDSAGHPAAAAEVRSGFACLNGLTDGWVSLMESLMTVDERHGADLSPDLRSQLDSALQFARRTVIRA